jgi:alpha-2-macroglobulin
MLHPSSSRAALAAVGILLCVGVLFSESASPPRGRGPSAAISRDADKQRAERLYQQGQWTEARSAFDQVLSATASRSFPEGRSHVERGIACSLKLHDFDNAFRRATEFQKRIDPLDASQPPWPYPGNHEVTGPIETVADLELVHRAFAQIDSQLPAQGHAPLKTRLKHARIALDLNLLEVLDPDGLPEDPTAGWNSRYPDMQWWINALNGRADADDGDADEWWQVKQSIPLTLNGKPAVLQTPASLEAVTARGAKILFLLSEVERLDSSPDRHDLARALLHRADIARRLYGPELDEDWRAGEFEYMMRGRPVFRKRRPRPGLKEYWQLKDDEARTFFAGRLRVIALPPSENPLALWSRIEKECPNSKEVPEAIYQRGFYYQNRLQFSQALGEYRRLVARFPKHRRALSAKKQIAVIEHADVLLGATGCFPSGARPKLWFACRNTGQVDFVARRFDLKGYLEHRLKAGEWWQSAYLQSDPFEFGSERAEIAADAAKFAGPEVARWAEAAPVSERVATHTTIAPLFPVGTYVVEARVGGHKEVSSSALIVVSDVAIVKKRLPKKLLLWTVNSRTGQPLARQKLTFHIEDPRDNDKSTWNVSRRASDERGVIEIDPPKDLTSSAIVVAESPGFAVCQLSSDPSWERPRAVGGAFAVTDRPVYRPGSTMQFRVWVREAGDGHYRPAKAGVKVRVNVEGPNRDEPISVEHTTDESGSVTGSIRLNPEASLGSYCVYVDGFDSSRDNPACKFTVEEYKKPEFEVTVGPPKTPPHLGDVITARISARYYAGAPVSRGRVKYEIVRRPHRMRYSIPREWDWLYGNGFGDYEYDYPWFDGTDDMQEEGTQDASDELEPSRDEPVRTGTLLLNADGWADLTIITANDPRASDQEYVISVDVRDESRRTIHGKGTVIASRQPLYAFAELDGGWYEPGSQAAVDLSTRSVQNTPIDVKGSLTLYRIGERADTVDQRAVGNWAVRTGAGGHIRFPFRAGDEGQYRLVFDVPDASQPPVRASVNFWVHGPKFDARPYRGAALEVIPDRRWYQSGETARILIHTAQPNVRLLLYDSFDQYWFVDVPGRARVLEVPLLARHMPNYFLEATLVAGGEMHTEKCELYVPPARSIVAIELRPDRPAYQPGQKGRVRIHAADASGKPVSGSLALTAYDKSLLSFQNEAPEGPRKLFLERRVYFQSSNVESSLQRARFGALGTFVCPEYHLENGRIPQMGAMGGSPGVPSDPSEGQRPAATAQRRDSAREERETEKEKDSTFAEALAQLRSNFADTAAWLPRVALDKNGTAEAEIVYPDSLTTWHLCGYLVTKETQVGDGASEVTTSKPFLVRLQTPRFAVENDEITLTANVHNDLDARKEVLAELLVPAALFEPLEKSGKPPVADKEGKLHLTAQAAIGPHSEHRFDWPLRARGEGQATITAEARCDEAGDAMRLEFPVRPHGTPGSSAQAGFAAADNLAAQSLSFELPPEVDPSKTRIEISLAPSAGGSIFDAIPFLAGYPYGCVEQTMSRFYPTVVAVDTLRKLGVDLKTLADTLRKLGPSRMRRWDLRPVVDPAELDRMTQAGLERLSKFHHNDGGWGWWEHDESTPYMTAYVLLGLDTAAGAGVKIDESEYSPGVLYLHESLQEATRKKHQPEQLEVRALVCYVLSLERSQQTLRSDRDTSFVERHRHTFSKEIQNVYSERANLNNYGRALLALALHHHGETQKAKQVLAEIVSAIHADQADLLAWISNSEAGWWHWYNSDIETNAWVLRALVAIDPQNPLAGQIANWLAANRNHGSYWRSTRDTAQAVHALAEYMPIARRETPEFTVDVAIDGRPVTKAKVGWNNGLVTGTRLVLDAKDLKAGRHWITLTKEHRGPLFYSIAARYFDRSELIRETGKKIHVERHYYRLSEPAAVATGARVGSRTRGTGAALLERTPLKNGDSVKVGDTVEVELGISSDDNYDFVAFEDPKPAGFEAVRLQSGYGFGDGLFTNVELRDENVDFFSEFLPRGRHVLRYQLRAEVPGSFQARPSQAFDMYNPEIAAQSSGIRLDVRD